MLEQVKLGPTPFINTSSLSPLASSLISFNQHIWGGVKIIGVNLYAGIQFPNGKILSVGIESPSGPYYQHYGAITEDTGTKGYSISNS